MVLVVYVSGSFVFNTNMYCICIVVIVIICSVTAKFTHI